jgi:hypothetical protein
MSDTYPAGAPIYLSAAVANNEGAPLANVPGAWTSDQGTLVQNPNNPDETTLTNAPIGTFNATFTTTQGSVVGTYQAAVTDNTPATVTITGSTTPPADESTPAPVETAAAA